MESAGMARKMNHLGRITLAKALQNHQYNSAANGMAIGCTILLFVSF